MHTIEQKVIFAIFEILKSFFNLELSNLMQLDILYGS